MFNDSTITVTYQFLDVKNTYAKDSRIYSTTSRLSIRSRNTGKQGPNG